MSFSEVLDQAAATAYLKKSVLGHVPQAMLFCGPSGVGKKKAALEFAKALNCQDFIARQEGDACGVCEHCRAIAAGRYADVVLADFLYQARLELKKEPNDKNYEEELEKELAKQQRIKVDTIRDITAKSQQKSAVGGWKVFIVDQAQSMQAEAANALLKFIEEPPQKTVWILLTDKKASMLKTILSRCQPLQFAPLTQNTVAQLVEQVAPETENAALAAQYGQGSVTRALRSAEALDLLQSAPQGAAWPAAVAAALPRTVVAARQQAQAIMDVLILAVHKAWVKEETPAQRQNLQQILKKLENYKTAVLRNVSPALTVETALMNLDKCQIELFG
ncbi:MAG: DNA polymerase III subunit delta' [Elusimicrobiaceae bacterium]|nr:DNA polymerase III subunit delta' [Elusimicrobiaceae bacterium]